MLFFYYISEKVTDRELSQATEVGPSEGNMIMDGLEQIEADIHDLEVQCIYNVSYLLDLCCTLELCHTAVLFEGFNPCF